MKIKTKFVVYCPVRDAYLAWGAIGNNYNLVALDSIYYQQVFTTKKEAARFLKVAKDGGTMYVYDQDADKMNRLNVSDYQFEIVQIRITVELVK